MGRGQDRSHREPLLSAYQEPLGADVVHHVRHAAIAPLDPVHARPFGIGDDFAVIGLKQPFWRSDPPRFRRKFCSDFNAVFALPGRGFCVTAEANICVTRLGFILRATAPIAKRLRQAFCLQPGEQ